MIMHSTHLLQVIHSKKWHFAKKRKILLHLILHTMFAANTLMRLFTSALAQKLALAKRKLHSSRVGDFDIA